MSFPLRRKRQRSVSPKPQLRSQTHLNPQTQSPLFATLPIELRLIIFSLALDCSPIPLTTRGLPRVVTVDWPEHGGPHVVVVRAARLISLLLSCARAHAEALPILYGVNMFSVGDSETIRLLAVGVGAPFIRKLDFDWRLFHPPIPVRPERGWLGWLRKNHLIPRDLLSGNRPTKTKWVETWDAMKKLENLQWLHIKLSVSRTWALDWQERESEFLTPLRYLLKDGAHGELKLPWMRGMPQGVAAEDMLKGWVVKRPAQELAGF